MISEKHLHDLLTSRYAYEHNMVSYIVKEGQQHFLTPKSCSYEQYLAEIQTLIASRNNTIKLEQLERLSSDVYNFGKRCVTSFKHRGPFTIHGFYAFPNSPSFGMHTDTQDVYAYCVFGEKRMIVNNKLTILTPGRAVYIPKNTPHKAVNIKESFMLSVGLEPFILDELKNHDNIC